MFDFDAIFNIYSVFILSDYYNSYFGLLSHYNTKMLFLYQDTFQITIRYIHVISTHKLIT